VGDAVAVVAAYREARLEAGSGKEVRAFASGAGGDLTPVTFSLSDIRCMPASSRNEAFQRQDRRWVPGAEVSRRVFLGEPDQPVDLVVLPHLLDEEPALRAAAMLRVGGQLLVLQPDPVAEDLACRTGLEPVDGRRRVYAKCGRGFGQSRPKPSTEPAESLEARQVQAQLVADHLKLARSLARRFSHHGESKDDLEQVALMALVKASRRYDRSHETSFSTYATASILGEIKRHFRDKTWSMRVPRSLQEHYLAVKEARESLTHELSRSPTITQIAHRLGVSDEVVLEAMEAGDNYWPESLDVGTFEGETGKDVPVIDRGFDLALDRQQFSTIIDRLAPRERLILKRLYFDNWTQRQVAEEIGVSQMQVSRLLGRLMDKLRSET
jgi:RNA polymerase sigma-B factor